MAINNWAEDVKPLSQFHFKVYFRFPYLNSYVPREIKRK
jgi:hypothetical protein